ncbi:MAG TPA: glycosyltransferase [Casimicrobiaceae bacterium]|nr:glycosyltransferase [Casimicrobiaceae bacterium]
MDLSPRNVVGHLQREVVRSFWHGAPLSSYQVLCLRSFLRNGFAVEVFTYQPEIGCPAGVTQRDAREVWPTDHVLCYQTGLGQGSPALHSDLFRYKLLQRYGGWWTDLDVFCFRRPLPELDIFFAAEPHDASFFNGAILKFPRRHPLLDQAIERSEAVGENASWGQIGPYLLAKLIAEHGLAANGQSYPAAYPLAWNEVAALFDPARCEEVKERCKKAWFIHLFNEVWRGAGVPQHFGPPRGSYLDWLFVTFAPDIAFHHRLEFPYAGSWIENRIGRLILDSELGAARARLAGLAAERDKLTSELGRNQNSPSGLGGTGSAA